MVVLVGLVVVAVVVILEVKVPIITNKQEEEVVDLMILIHQLIILFHIVYGLQILHILLHHMFQEDIILAMVLF
ncbi:MAG: hypothetical protein EBZ69_01245 [Alphaproteobacteria bacterium]|nr:hypothetical protein [Alphaproteobacteria bacterium]